MYPNSVYFGPKVSINIGTTLRPKVYTDYLGTWTLRGTERYKNPIAIVTVEGADRTLDPENLNP